MREIAQLVVAGAFGGAVIAGCEHGVGIYQTEQYKPRAVDLRDLNPDRSMAEVILLDPESPEYTRQLVMRRVVEERMKLDLTKPIILPEDGK